MTTCSLCNEPVTNREIREGSAISRGSELYHRECHRTTRGVSAAPLPRQSVASPDAATWTSYPEIGVSTELAGFWRRFGAHLIDGIILNVVVIFAGMMIGLGMGMAGVVNPSAASIFGGLVGGILPLVYCVWFWVKKGATPGKMVLGIRVVGSDDQPPSGMASFVRFIGYIPSGLVFGLGYLWMLFDSENRCWHDMMAGTRVVRV
jgi:uncharacterized RDD family membrane protein YckC